MNCLKNLVCLAFMSLVVVGCSSSQVDDFKRSFSEEAGRGVEGGFEKLAKTELSAEEFEAKGCLSEAAYYGGGVEEYLKEKSGVKSKMVASKSLAGDACGMVMPLALDYALEKVELKPCAKAIGKIKLLKLGGMACDYLDEKL